MTKEKLRVTAAADNKDLPAWLSVGKAPLFQNHAGRWHFAFVPSEPLVALSQKHLDRDTVNGRTRCCTANETSQCGLHNLASVCRTWSHVAYKLDLRMDRPSQVLADDWPH